MLARVCPLIDRVCALRACMRLHLNRPVPGAVATFSHDVQGVGDLLSSECVNRPEGRRSLHVLLGHAVAPALQEPAKGGRHVLSI